MMVNKMRPRLFIVPKYVLFSVLVSPTTDLGESKRNFMVVLVQHSAELNENLQV